MKRTADESGVISSSNQSVYRDRAAERRGEKGLDETSFSTLNRKGLDFRLLELQKQGANSVDLISSKIEVTAKAVEKSIAKFFPKVKYEVTGWKIDLGFNDLPKPPTKIVNSNPKKSDCRSSLIFSKLDVDLLKNLQDKLKAETRNPPSKLLHMTEVQVDEEEEEFNREIHELSSEEEPESQISQSPKNEEANDDDDIFVNVGNNYLEAEIKLAEINKSRLVAPNPTTIMEVIDTLSKTEIEFLLSKIEKALLS